MFTYPYKPMFTYQYTNTQSVEVHVRVGVGGVGFGVLSSFERFGLSYSTCKYCVHVQISMYNYLCSMHHAHEFSAHALFTWTLSITQCTQVSVCYSPTTFSQSKKKKMNRYWKWKWTDIELTPISSTFASGQILHDACFVHNFVINFYLFSLT